MSRNPVRIIRPIEIRPVPYTMAFGGVDTGSMNPHEAARAVGTTSVIGATPSPTASAPTIGRKVAAAAVLLA
ncbi:MAG TPA: hypothetical protein VK012_03495, partial [Gemmatimonadales bacterium]|nr:hypothetical protein [Gemmatimonadales bacterium]